MSVNDKISMEYEARNMLSEVEYEKIKDYFLSIEKEPHFIKNKNIYYDRKDLYLINHHMMLRIREINDEPKEVTLKVKGSDGDKEITRVITHPIDYSKTLLEQDLLNDEMLEVFIKANINPKDIILITSLLTERIEIEKEDHIIVIDKNYYSDVVDYNIEIESTSREVAKKILLEICDKFRVIYKENYLTKSKRAIKALK